MNLVSNRWEYLCIGLSHRKPRSNKYVTCNVYRKPGGTTEEMTTFTNEFCNLLNELKRMKHDIYTCGDYNINLLILIVIYIVIFFLQTLCHADFIQKSHCQHA